MEVGIGVAWISRISRLPVQHHVHVGKPEPPSTLASISSSPGGNLSVPSILPAQLQTSVKAEATGAAKKD